MFLSLYMSFRWEARENYILKITVFTIIASLISAQVGTTFFAMLGWDDLAILSIMLSVLNPSFPFLSCDVFSESRLALPPPYNFSQRIRNFQIRLPAMSVLQLVPQGPVERSNGEDWVNVLSYRLVFLETEIGSVPPDAPSVIGTLFLFFLLVNVIGALLGFVLSRLPTEKVPILNRVRDTMSLFLRALFGAVFLVVGIWFSTIGKVILNSPVSRYYSSYNPYLYVGDAYACVVFGIIWLAIVVVEEEIL